MKCEVIKGNFSQYICSQNTYQKETGNIFFTSISFTSVFFLNLCERYLFPFAQVNKAPTQLYSPELSTVFVTHG